MSWKTSTIDHDARIRMGLSMNDYVLLDHIYRTQTSPKYGGKNGGWCDMSFDVVSSFFGISKGGISGIFKKLTDDGFMEVSGKKRRTTEKWFSHYDNDVQKVNACSESEQVCSESEQHTILYKHKEINNPLPLSGELQARTGSSAAAQVQRKPPATWDAVLASRATPKLDGTVAPSPSGDIWERRLHVFDAVRRKYPGTKSGLLQEFNGFLRKCWKDKLDMDKELSQMPYAVLYQIKWRESKEQMEEFAAAWKNFSSWVNQCHWQADMDSWKSRAEWFSQLCPDDVKSKVEALKSILPCK